MAAEKTATYSIRADSNAKSVGDEGAAALQRLKETIEGSQAAIKEMSNSFRALRGSSDEVKTAKSKLTAQIDAEKNAISASSLALLKQGSSYGKLADETRKAELAAKKFEAAQQKAQAKDLASQVTAAKKAAEDAKTQFEELNKPVVDVASGMAKLQAVTGGAFAPIAAIVGAITAMTAVAIAAGVAIFDLALAVGRWIIVAGDATRAARLEREAWLGSEQQARALGNQIDALRAKVPTTREELQKLALETNRAFAQSRANGQTIVDTFNTVAVAGAAMNEAVANQLGDLIKRAKDIGRVQIQPLDLRGTTLALKDIAAELAKVTKTSVAQAEANLRAGVVPIDQAAAAIRAAVEKRFGAINAKKMLSLDSLKSQLKDTLGALTKDVNLEPLLEGLSKLVHMLDQSTVAGHALKGLIDIVSKQLGPVFEKLAPIAQEAFVRIEIQAYRLIAAALDVRDKWRATFQGTSLDALTMADATNAITFALTTLGTLGVAQVHMLGNGFIRLVKVIMTIADAIASVKAVMTGWYELGTSMVDGLVNGIKAGVERLKKAVGDLAEDAKKVFKEKLGIHSPSSVFHQYGDDGIDEGAAQGIDHGAPRVQDAVDRMAPMPPAGRAGAQGAGSSASAPIMINVTVDASGASADAVKYFDGAEFETAMLRVFERALNAAGIPTQSPAVAT